MDTLAAALAGAVLAVMLVGGPLWLVAPGLLGAGLPALLARARSRGPDQLSPGSRLPADPS